MSGATSKLELRLNKSYETETAYVINIEFNGKGSITQGELEIGDFSNLSLPISLFGAVVYNPDSSFVGTFNISTTGRLYINFTTTITGTSYFGLNAYCLK